MLKPSVQIHDENGTIVAEFWDCHRLDPGPVQDLKTKYEAHVKAGGKAELVVDLLGVGYAGSAALGHFVALHRFARTKGGRLIFCNVEPNVFEVFRVSKLDPLFTFEKDRPAALLNAADPSAGGARRPPEANGDPSAAPPRHPSSSGGAGLLRGRRKSS